MDGPQVRPGQGALREPGDRPGFLRTPLQGHIRGAGARARVRGQRGRDLGGFERITAWRISFTLREFPSADHVDAWFDYPLHITDATGVLAKCTYGGAETKSTDGSGQPKAKARTDKQAALEEAFEATSMGDESVRISDLAEYLEVSPRTVKRYVDESRAFERSNGGIRRIG